MSSLDWPPSKAYIVLLLTLTKYADEIGSMLMSRPFLFVVGQDQTEFHVHVEVISRLSHSLSTLVHGNMSEAKDHQAVLEDVDENLFACFMQYAYTGDYCEPTPMHENGDFVNHVRGTAAYIRAQDRLEPSTPLKKKKHVRADDLSKKDLAWQSFQSKAQTRPPSLYQPRPNTAPSEEYTRIFLCHAAIYVLADKYGIDHLQDLAITKLRRTLSVFTLYPERIDDVVRLARYGYSHTGDHECRQDSLRSLISEFVSCRIELLAQNDGFKSTMKEDGSFACDVLQLVLQLWP